MTENRLINLLLVAPALLLVAGLFLYPLGYSVAGAFLTKDGRGTWEGFLNVYQLYTTDILFTVVIITVATILVGICAVLIGGFLVLGTSPVLVGFLKWLYRWPLFIPFVVAGQCMRAFLAKNGLMNNSFVSLGLLEPLQTQSFLDWRGIIIAFVWKQTAFAALLVAGAMASLDRSTIEAAQDMGASRPRILVEIIVPQIRQTLAVTLVLSFVTMLSVLSVPMMVGSGTPTMITVDMAFRINSYGDYTTANALGLVSMVLAGSVAWIYLRHSLKEGQAQ